LVHTFHRFRAETEKAYDLSVSGGAECEAVMEVVEGKEIRLGRAGRGCVFRSAGAPAGRPKWRYTSARCVNLRQ
jgi:hypothetical protein